MPTLDGLGPARWPTAPVLLAPILLPVRGDYAGTWVWYDVDAVMRWQSEADTYRPDLLEAQAALDADMTLSETEREQAEADIALTWLLRSVQVLVGELTNPRYPAGLPSPADPLAFYAAMPHPAVLHWIATTGAATAAAEYAGPKRMARSLPAP